MARGDPWRRPSLIDWVEAAATVASTRRRDTRLVHRGIVRDVAMTLRLSDELLAELRMVAEEDRRSVHQAVIVAIETYLADRETDEIMADAETLRALADARDAVASGDVEYGTDAVHALVQRRQAS